MRLVVLKEKSGETWILILCMLVSMKVLSGFYVGHPRMQPPSATLPSKETKPPQPAAKTQSVYKVRQNK